MMSRASAALAFVLFLGSAAWAQEARRITPASLVVRSGPGNTYSSIGTATAGQKYVVYSTSGSWRRIFWNGSKGWIHASYATNLVPGDANGQPDVFVRDLQTDTTLCISVATDGTQSDNMSQIAAFSADGRYVAFQSWGTNLVAGDTNGQVDIFLRDMLAGTTTRVSVASDGSQANSYSWGPSLSADGRYLAFASLASNLVAGDTNTQRDVFVRDLQAGTVTRISVTSAGAQTFSPGADTVEWPVISANGRHVAWTSTSYGLVTGDTNYVLDVFTHDRQTGVTERAGVSTSGVQGNLDSLKPSISSDGRYVTFESSSHNFASSTYSQIGAYARKRW